MKAGHLCRGPPPPPPALPGSPSPDCAVGMMAEWGADGPTGNSKPVLERGGGKQRDSFSLFSFRTGCVRVSGEGEASGRTMQACGYLLLEKWHPAPAASICLGLRRVSLCGPGFQLFRPPAFSQLCFLPRVPKLSITWLVCVCLLGGLGYFSSLVSGLREDTGRPATEAVWSGGSWDVEVPGDPPPRALVSPHLTLMERP